MKCKILHESRGRLRVHLLAVRMTLEKADLTEYYLKQIPGVTDARDLRPHHGRHHSL